MPTSSPLNRFIVLGSLFASSLAAAEAKQSTSPGAHPRPMYKRVPGARNVNDGPAYLSSRLVYVHRCPAGGCSVKTGTDDSRTDTSSIADGFETLGAFPHGDAVWNEMYECVKTTFAPFNITITDQDPGTEPHFENMVGGKVSDITADPDLANAGGVAPFDCGEIPNAIVYTFAGSYGPDAEELCWTCAQEIAHAFGLEHEFLQKDPMTYLSGDLPKRFRDETASCGELQKRTCQCAQTSQNSYRAIVGLFGPGAPTPPTVAFKRPVEGRELQPGFTAVVESIDDVRVEKVELYIDGTLAGTAMTPISDEFDIVAPRDLAQGSHTFEARATDVQGVVNTTTMTAIVGAPCTADEGCTDTDVCVEGVCIPGPDEPGGLGSICQKETECLSHACGDAGEDLKHCVAACDLASAESCPNGFECLDTGAGGGLCWPNGGGGCCDTSGTRPHGPMLLGLGVAIVLLRRRRRR